MWQFSNFKALPLGVVHEGLIYPTVEHFYQAMKATSLEERVVIKNLDHPAQAKKYWRGRGRVIRPDWGQIKLRVMRYALRQKFFPGTPDFYELMNTGTETIIELNTWHDNFWGECGCSKCVGKPGQNHLGAFLMEIREEGQQLIQKVGHIKTGQDGINIGRPSKWGNKWSSRDSSVIGTTKVATPEEAVLEYLKWMLGRTGEHEEERRALLEALPELKVKKLLCWCRAQPQIPLRPCHGDALNGVLFWR